MSYTFVDKYCNLVSQCQVIAELFKRLLPLSQLLTILKLESCVGIEPTKTLLQRAGLATHPTGLKIGAVGGTRTHDVYILVYETSVVATDTTTA